MTDSTQNAPFFVDAEVIRLTKNGVWLSDETEIDHEQTLRLFARSLRRDEQGYFLQIGRETKRIIVEDTPFFVTRVEVSSGGVELGLSDDSVEQLDSATLAYRPGRLTCRLKRGDEAKFLHAPYFELLKELEEDADSYWIQVGGKRVVLAPK